MDESANVMSDNNVIPVTFELKGKQYQGFLSKVAGAGNDSSFHLMINNYYIGHLFYTTEWVFYGNKLDGNPTEELREFLGMVVTGWYQ